jgi:hypothetical protein
MHHPNAVAYTLHYLTQAIPMSLMRRKLKPWPHRPPPPPPPLLLPPRP